jgi:hypothetical protein
MKKSSILLASAYIHCFDMAAKNDNASSEDAAYQSDPARATWKEEEGLRLLCIDHVVASNVRVFGALPSLYLM